MSAATSQQPDLADPSKLGWASEEIQDRLPVTHEVIASRAGVTRQFVGSVISGRQKSRKVEVEIAKALRTPRLVIWPDRKEPKRGLKAIRAAQEGAQP
jgi:lambda repressor-like predicted transcriptional regulator